MNQQAHVTTHRRQFMARSAGAVAAVGLAPNANAALAGEELAGTMVTFDFLDATQYNATPLDNRWYDWIFSNCRKHGLKHVFFRVSLGRAYYRSRVIAPVSAEANHETGILRLAKLLDGEGPEAHDPLQKAVEYAHKYGVELHAWFPFNEAYYINPDFRNLIDPWYAERPHLFWCDRGGRPWMGMPCVAEPEVVERTATIVEELCSYGVDGVFITPRSHCYKPYAPGQQAFDVHDDQFGFNEPVRKRYLDRFGVDIRKDAFDVDAWQKVKGEFYTEFLSRCAEVAHKHGCRLWAGTAPRRVGYIPNLSRGNRNALALRLYNDWEAWHGRARVDGIVAVQSRSRIAPPCQLDPRESICDAREITAAVPDCHVSIFQCVSAYCNRTGKSWDWNNFVPETPAMLEEKLRIAHRQGASSILFQEMYIHLFVDTRGKDIGIGACPQQEYWDAIARWTGKV